MLLYTPAFGQPDTAYLHFQYGSRPAKGYKSTEKIWFGGLKGGHVSLEIDGVVLDFLPGKNPLFPHNKKPSGGYKLNQGLYWNAANDNKRSVVCIPITAEQKTALAQVFQQWGTQTPYDYAIFGMRCAAATYDVLSEAGIVKPLRNENNIIRHFYPKLLRKRIYKWAKEKGWPIRYYEGKVSRKWESDKGIF